LVWTRVCPFPFVSGGGGGGEAGGEAAPTAVAVAVPMPAPFDFSQQRIMFSMGKLTDRVLRRGYASTIADAPPAPAGPLDAIDDIEADRTPDHLVRACVRACVASVRPVPPDKASKR
jgi:hypothetical protein